jgi:peptidyl-prolyl isomerase D
MDSGNGTGGESIYGEKFEDENFVKLVSPFLSSLYPFPQRTPLSPNEPTLLFSSFFLNHRLQHDKKFLLSMANAGPNTNGSQFFITTSLPAHLDGKHVVFGSVISGKSLVRRIENLPTKSGDCPVEEVKIEECGVLSEGETVGAEGAKGAEEEGGDVYEDW